MSRVILWTDSLDVLFWIRGQGKQTQYVRNRVNEIQKETNANQWRHVPGKLNPADLLSRGMKAKELVTNLRWKHGHEFLSADEASWPQNPIPGLSEETKETESKEEDLHFTTQEIEDRSISQIMNPERYSKWIWLVRRTAWILRFVHNIKEKRMQHDLKQGTLPSKNIWPDSGQFCPVSAREVREKPRCQITGRNAAQKLPRPPRPNFRGRVWPETGQLNPNSERNLGGNTLMRRAGQNMDRFCPENLGSRKTASRPFFSLPGISAGPA